MKQDGNPSERARKNKENPKGMLRRYVNYFDIVFMEGGVLHYFHDIDEFMQIMYKLEQNTMSEIINAIIKSGFNMEKFDEHPAWTNSNIPGEFTVVAKRQ